MEHSSLELQSNINQLAQSSTVSADSRLYTDKSTEIGEENVSPNNGSKHVSGHHQTHKSIKTGESDLVAVEPSSHNGNIDRASSSINSSTLGPVSTEGTELAHAIMKNEEIVNDTILYDGSIESEPRQSNFGSAEGTGENNNSDADGNKRRAASDTHEESSKKKKQSVLNFSRAEGHTSFPLPVSSNGDSSTVMDDSQMEEDGYEDAKPSKGLSGEFVVTLAYRPAESQKRRGRAVKSKDQPKEKVRNFDRAAKKPIPKPKPLHLPLTKLKKVSTRSKLEPTTTTILRENNRNARPLPGPLVPLHYSLYDGNVIKRENNSAIAAEKLAFGFPTKHNPNLYDIMYILLFLSKFEPVVQAGKLGPDDFEIGLDLESALRRPNISQKMEVFFRRLLELLLNRKKLIPKEGQRPAIQELQAKYSTFGLPEEWRDDSSIHEVDSFPCNPEDDVVDPSQPPVAPEDLLEYEGPKELSNPFHSKEFEDHGLAGVESPRQRVILLRTMVVWCLSVSMRVKTHLTSIVSKQEVPGERDNIYVARSVMKGFVQTLESKKDHEVKVARKTKPTSKGGMQDFDLRLAYMDPTSNPMTHPLALRLNEYVIGDIGFHVGRFYLVRTADASAGGLGSLEEMKSSVKLSAGDRSMATNFRLYVEDVYSLLDSSLRVDGVEFDSHGHEVPHNAEYDDTKYWYTVASNYEELQAFTDHVELKLSTKANPGVVTNASDAYRPLLHMYQYLRHVTPIIGELEGMYVSGSGEVRAARKKMDYSAVAAWDEEMEEYPENKGDDDYSEDGEEGFEVEEEVEDEADFLDE